MKFINKYIIFSVLAFALLGTACNDLLDELPENKSYVSDTDYTKQEGMTSYLIGVYSGLYDRGWEDFPLIAVRGDDVNAGGLGDQQDYAETDKYKYNQGYWMYNSLWKNFYNNIFYTYSSLEEIEKYKQNGVDSILARQYVAEIKTIRAYLLFQLSRVWGDIFIPNSSDPINLINAQVSSKEDVMKYISGIMDESIPYLPDMNPKDRADIPGGVTKYTALTMKALANLELKNYQAVADATGPIINSGKYVLESDFYELFKVKKGKLNRENILELQYSDLGASVGGKNYLFGFFGPQGWSPKVAGSGDGWGFYEPSIKYIKFMLDRGESVRLETSVLFTNRGIEEIKKDSKYAILPSWLSNTTRSGDVINDYSRAMFASGKHYLPSDQLTAGRKDYGTNKNFTCIRYAEVLLMYAEALTQGATGSAGTALNAVNQVRSRAGMSALTSLNNDQVMDEKFAELAMEWGTRYYDMIRLEKYSELSYDGRTFDKSKAYLPYPQEQVDYLPGLQK